MFQTIGAAVIVFELLGLSIGVMGICTFLIVRHEESDGSI
jgi:hypothetical protein